MTEILTWLDRAQLRLEVGDGADAGIERACRLLDARAAMLELVASPQSCASLRDLMALASTRLHQAAVGRSPAKLQEARIIVDSLAAAYQGAF
jgi:hypothetical protein